MKVYSVMLFRWLPLVEAPHPALLSSACELSSFGMFQRSGAKEVFLFVSREVTGRSQPGQRQCVLHQGHVCCVQVRQDGLACAVVSDQEYPTRVAFGLVAQALDDFCKAVPEDQWKKVTKDAAFNVGALDTLLAKYQDPQSADKLEAIKKDLDETKAIMMKSIDQLLERGEKLENLTAKSEDLSFQSKAFLNRSEDLNRCCILI